VGEIGGNSRPPEEMYLLICRYISVGASGGS